MTTTALTRRDRSICSLVWSRQAAACPSFSPTAFERGVSRYFQTKQLLADPEIISPHTSAITSLSVDKSNVGRFLLAGSADGTLSIFDISKWGSEHFLKGNKHSSSSNGSNHHHRHYRHEEVEVVVGRTAYHPIARSIKVPAANSSSPELDIPSGHSSSVTHVQWYEVDTGAFLSSASDGNTLLWDTNRMEPILKVNPYPTLGGVGSAHLQTGGDYSLVATGSWNHPVLKLVDIRSGSHSHELIGHGGGISAVQVSLIDIFFLFFKYVWFCKSCFLCFGMSDFVLTFPFLLLCQWSPTMPVILASGARDGSIRLWDIRKSGSRACITVLNQEGREKVTTTTTSCSYKADYSHLRIPDDKKKKKDNKKRKLNDQQQQKQKQLDGAPNNYHSNQNTIIRSHATGHVSAISFFPCGQYLASIGGVRGDLHLWDMKLTNRLLVPSKFVSLGRGNACTTRQRRNALKIVDRTIWVGNEFHVQGYDMAGGLPTQVLIGHLNTVTSIEQMLPSKTLITGSRDGMILCWGTPKVIAPRRPVQRNEDCDNW